MYAFICIYARIVLYPAYRRKDSGHVPVRQRVPVGCQHSDSIYHQPLYSYACAYDVLLRSDDRPYKVYHRFYPGKEGHMASESGKAVHSGCCKRGLSIFKKYFNKKLLTNIYEMIIIHLNSSSNLTEK